MIAALVPAAGLSLRMGQPKLLLTIGGVPLIARVVAALKAGGADLVVVVVPAAEVPGAERVAREAEKAGASLVVPPAPTADMRASVELGLERLEQGPAPESLLLAPGDSPGITDELVGRVIACAREYLHSVVVPVCAGRRGHPVLLPWPLTSAIRSLPPGSGINALLSEPGTRVVELEVVEPATADDLDTPEDYQRWLRC